MAFDEELSLALERLGANIVPMPKWSEIKYHSTLEMPPVFVESRIRTPALFVAGGPISMKEIVELRLGLKRYLEDRGVLA